MIMVEQRKYYKLSLRTLSPVHIGSGEKAGTKDFIFENGEYYFPDMIKLYREIVNHGEQVVDNYDIFLLGQGNGNRLINFLKENQIKNRNFGGYKIKAHGYEEAEKQQTDKSPIVKLGRMKEVSLFIKDPYGKPYIPGSSMKGAIRTILVNQYFKKDNNRRNSKAIPWGSQHEKRYFDTFNNIRVGDSQTIDIDKLVLAQKTDFSKTKGIDTPLPLTRECIKPLTLITFPVTAVGVEAIQIMDNLMKYAKQHYQEYETLFLNEFPDELNQNSINAPLTNLAPIYLGAGAGLWTKVILSESKNIMKIVSDRSPYKMKMKGKGTLKLTRVGTIRYKLKGKSYALIDNHFNLSEMGRCGFSLKEVERGLKI